MGLPGPRLRTSAMTARARSSLRGASTTMKWSAISMATLWCEPPVMYHTPSATIWFVTIEYGDRAWRTESGTGAVTGTLVRTSVTLRSRVGKPPADWRIFIGNFTPPTSAYSEYVTSTG